MEASPESRVEQALATAKPFPALWQLATELRNSGMSQADLRALFESALARYPASPEDTCHDALADTLDFIVGWCPPDKAFYPDAPVA